MFLKLLKLYALVLVVFLVIDFSWFGFFAKGFYLKNIGNIMKPVINWAPALLFYLIFVFALIYFVLYPNLILQLNFYRAVISAALLGLVSYATFNLTNMAILNWPLAVVLVDTSWGALVTALVTTITIFLWKFL